MPSRRREDDDKNEEKRLDEKGHKMDKLSHDDEVRRILKWLSFARPKVVFGFDHLSPAFVPTMATKTRGMAFCFERISGWRPPPIFVNQIYDDGNVEVSVQLSLSMFHITSGSFFGSTWMGKKVVLNDDSDLLHNTIEIEYEDIIYIVSRLTDPSCIGVIEIVVSKIDKRKNIGLGQYGCGWALLNIFSQKSGSLPDIMDGAENIFTTICPFYEGSPRDLIKFGSMEALVASMKEISGCVLHYKVMSNKRLLRAQRLVAENEIIGRFEVVAGLVPKAVTLPGSTQARLIACVGDEEKLDPKQIPYLMPAKPSVAMPITLKLIECMLHCPDRMNMERRMAQHVAKHVAALNDVQVIGRRLKVGIHNGHTLVGGDWQTMQLFTDKREPDTLMVGQSDATVEINGYVPHELMAMVMLVEYELSTPIPPQSHLNTKTMLETTIRNGKLVVTLVLGAAVFVPFEGNVFLGKNSESEELGNDEVGIELSLRVDDTCSLLSSKAAYKDVDENGDPVGGSVSGRKLDRAAAAKGKGGSGGDDEVERFTETATNITIGFDLTAFDPARGEIKHGDEIDVQDDTTPIKMPAVALADHKAIDPKDGNQPEYKSTAPRPVKQKTPVAPSKVQRTLTDDASSISDSLVEGDAGASSLRLDMRYYGDQAPQHLHHRPHSQSPFTPSDAASVSSTASVDPHFVLPRDPRSLLARAMQAKLVTRDDLLSGSQPERELIETDERDYRTRGRGIGAMPVTSANAHVREISRGARSRLNRYGFDDVILDGKGGQSRPVSKHSSASAGLRADIDHEAGDPLSLHDISIQFAGYRAGGARSEHRDLPNPSVYPQPRSIYFSFQFFSCMPTRTEVMRLLPADSGQLSVLARDEAHARDEAPLSLRFSIDCSSVSPNEAKEFAEYLAKATLFVDVWDADSLLLLGTAGIPLRRLMRQRRPVTKCAIECDIMNSDMGALSQGGISSLVINEGGPVSGVVVGSVNIILCNFGQMGTGPSAGPAKAQSQEDVKPPTIKGGFGGASGSVVEGLNWRAYGVEKDGRQWAGTSKLASRPRVSVRARPLSESAPELNQVLQDHRATSETAGVGVMRSLSMPRGIETTHSLTYDEVLVLFKRFNGTVKGTVQYVGPFMKLLDVPSLAVASRKLIKVYQLAEGAHIGTFEVDARHFADRDGVLEVGNILEFFYSVFERYGVTSKAEEVNILARHFIRDENGSTRVQDIVKFCQDEATRQEWGLVGQRIRRATQAAYMQGADVEQVLADFDRDGDDIIDAKDFKEFLKILSHHGKLSPRDVMLTVRHFGEVCKEAGAEQRGVERVSLPNVMAFLGRKYVGNVNARLRNVVIKEGTAGAVRAAAAGGAGGGNGHSTPVAVAEYIHHLLSQFDPNGKKASTLSYEELEMGLTSLGVYKELSHEQVRSVIHKLDSSGRGGIQVHELMAHWGLVPEKPHHQEESLSTPNMSAEDLLRILLERVQQNGVAVDEAFRHFDENGDGLITPQEMLQGLDRLGIFSNIDGWQLQISKTISGFDKDKDGHVSLKEFFQFLGMHDYAPTIIQRMTKIFAVAQDKGLSFENIFHELDGDGDGKMTAEELLRGLQKLGTFGDLSEGDVRAVVEKFDSDGNGNVSLNEFIAFFKLRVDLAKKERRRKRTHLLTKRFREVLTAAGSKGLGPAEIFNHFDKDKGGTLSTEELVVGIKSLPHFRGISESDVKGLVEVLDSDNSGAISLDEFVEFMKMEDPSHTRCEKKPIDFANIEDVAARLRVVFVNAEKRGLSLETAFKHLDSDGSGDVETKEFAAAVKALPHFRELRDAEINALMALLDEDSSGTLSLSEFTHFVREGVVMNKVERQRGKGEGKSGGESKNEMKSEEFRKDRESLQGVRKDDTFNDRLIRCIRKIAEKDNGVDGLLAFLDQDEDGLISTAAFLRMFRREGMFEELDENEVKRALEVHSKGKDGQLSVVSLLRFVEGRNVQGGRGVVPTYANDEDESKSLDFDYNFSKDPEVHALEKKIRGLGRLMAKKGVNVESMFRAHDARDTGMIRRTAFIEVLSKIGLYILEKGRVIDVATVRDGEDEGLRKLQQAQMMKLKGKGASYALNASRAARKLIMTADDGPKGDFNEHLESMALINWYRESQKRLLLQRVLSHSLATSVNIYPRFGKTLFFEQPVVNPFAHEERFIIDLGGDAELRLVTAFDEWLHLRHTIRPCVGELGAEPVEAEMFDRDGYGNIQVSLLANETLYLPFTFMTLLPSPPQRTGSGSISGLKMQPTKLDFAEERKSDSIATASPSAHDEEEPSRSIDVKIISGSHGHIIAVIHVYVCRRPAIVHRTLRFFEVENSVMKRRIQLLGYDSISLFPGSTSPVSKYVHCVEGPDPTTGDSRQSAQSNVVVEWGPAGVAGGIDLLLRYRCSSFPSVGNFFLLLFDDPYQAQLHEVWRVIIQTRQRLDVHGSVGATSPVDLVVRGDRFARRARAFVSLSTDRITFKPDAAFQLVPGAFNRVIMFYNFKGMGSRRLQVNLVDVESRELISAWLVSATAVAPAIMRTYDVDVLVGKSVNKKIVFKNPWDIPKRFTVTSSDEDVMKPRVALMDVAPHGNAYLRLLFNGIQPGQGVAEVYLFLNDEIGQNEECFLFRAHESPSGGGY